MFPAVVKHELLVWPVCGTFYFYIDFEPVFICMIIVWLSNLLKASLRYKNSFFRISKRNLVFFCVTNKIRRFWKELKSFVNAASNTVIS